MRQRWITYLATAGAVASLFLLATVSFAVVMAKVAIAVIGTILIFIAAKLRRND
jgi:hypothetical protein